MIAIRNQFESIRKKLKSLPDGKLLGDLSNLHIRERRLRATVLLYLIEIDRRELFVPLGFSSMFEFCTGHLGYTR